MTDYMVNNNVYNEHLITLFFQPYNNIISYDYSNNTISHDYSNSIIGYNQFANNVDMTYNSLVDNYVNNLVNVII